MLEPQIEKVILAAIVLISALPVLRFAVKRPVLRELREQPMYALGGLTGALFAGALLAWAWSSSIAVLRVLCLAAVLGALAAYVRSRPGYGKSRGLPPGSLGLRASIDSICDERYYRREAERWGPVFKMMQINRPVVCIVDLADGFAFLEANKDRLEQSSLPFSQLIPGGYIEFMDGGQHKRFRDILQPALSGAVIDDRRGSVSSLMRDQLSNAAASAANLSEGGIKPAELLDDIAFTSLLEIFFGISPTDPRFGHFHQLYSQIDFRTNSYTRVPRELRAAFERTVSAVEELARRIDRTGQRSVLSEILGSPAAAEQAEAMPTVIGNLIFMMAVARDDLQGYLLWILKMICDEPQYALRLREGVGATDQRAVNIIKETLRLRQSEYVYRDVKADCRLREYTIPKGWRVRLCLTECHRLESVFEHPDAFRPERFEERTYGKDQYCPFSEGQHACFGARLAMMVGQAFLRELLDGFDWEKTADGPDERGNRQWHHWKPSASFRVAFTPR